MFAVVSYATEVKTEDWQSKNTSVLRRQCSATEPRQPDNHQPILYKYCTGSTECLSYRPGNYSVCAIRTTILYFYMSLRQGKQELEKSQLECLPEVLGGQLGQGVHQSQARHPFHEVLAFLGDLGDQDLHWILVDQLLLEDQPDLSHPVERGQYAENQTAIVWLVCGCTKLCPQRVHICSRGYFSSGMHSTLPQRRFSFGGDVKAILLETP